MSITLMGRQSQPSLSDKQEVPEAGALPPNLNQALVRALRLALGVCWGHSRVCTDKHPPPPGADGLEPGGG